MRQRKIRHLDEKIGAHDSFVVENPKEHRGKWAEMFKEPGPLYLEIGCGKGQFVTDLAVKHPEWNLLAFEGHQSVALHALEKADEKDCSNVRFVLEYINGLCEIFDDGEVDGIFLNFSDPWPKARHEKRRLTCETRLSEYARVVKNGGFVEFKTDNDELFEYSITQVENLNMEIAEMYRDLHDAKAPEEIVTTEYEDKFAAEGKKINFMKINIL